MEKSNTTERNKQTFGGSREVSYLWIAEPEVQAAEVGEEAEASEENPVLETGDKQPEGGKVK